MLLHLVARFALAFVAAPSLAAAQTPPSTRASDARAIEADSPEARAREQSSDPLRAESGAPPEYLVFEVPDLPLYGSAFHSWFVLRGPLLWTPSGTIDMKKVIMPKWDTVQVPPAITYNGSQALDVVISDASDAEIERIHLKKSWSPQLYQPPAGRVPHHFRFELATRPERLRMITRDYDWPKTTQVFHCDVEVVEKDYDTGKFQSAGDSLVGQGASDDKKQEPLEAHPKVKLCMESLDGIAKNAASGKQWYIDIVWPKPQTRRSQMYISERERELKSRLSKNKHVLITHRSLGRNFIATAGLTNVEKLESPAIQVGSLPKKEWHGEVPPREQEFKPVATFTTPDNGRVVISAFPRDQIDKRSLDAPSEFVPPINLQFVRAPASAGPALRQTEFHEERTGITGFLRPWLVKASANYHLLKSGRGEETSSLNAPALELAWKSPYYDLEPFATFDTGTLHYDSSLALQEGHVGSRWRRWAHIYPSVGYFFYGLSGRNPGSTTLGSMDGISFGVYSMFRIEDYILRGWINGIYSDPISYDAFVEVSKIFNRHGSDNGFHVGVFAGYTSYRSTLTNTVRALETFSENRLKIGVTIGLAGSEYLKDRHEVADPKTAPARPVESVVSEGAESAQKR